MEDKSQDEMLAHSYGWTTFLCIKPKSGYLWISLIPLFYYCHHLSPFMMVLSAV